MMYLHRIPLLTENRFYESYGVQEKFFEGDVGLMKRLKKCLGDAEAYYNDSCLKITDDLKKMFYSECGRLFKAYFAWLEETQLNKFTSLNIALPPQYEVARLKRTFSGDRVNLLKFNFVINLLIFFFFHRLTGSSTFLFQT